jgi:4-amino-4-deoxy-L-arabinose transferase-like glycosyltransferase
LPGFLPIPLYRFLFLLTVLCAIPGLFIPLMDNDAAHHALIALRMHQTGDYINLVDHGGDYLDKPHLHFWLVSLSYKIWGVNGFAYKFPSFLAAVLGVYSTFRLGWLLYSKETGRLASLMLATCFGFLLSVSDVRMDALLVSFIVFASWQMVSLAQTKKWKHVAGAALGLALGFATKGHIAVFIPTLFCFLYLAWKKELGQLLSLQWLSVIALFFLFISPVLYCYYLQFNQHPETTVRGRNNIEGVKFILWDQVFDRISGRMEKQTHYDPLFFFHSFIAAFAPWSILAFVAVGDRIRRFRENKWELAGSLLFLIVCILVSLSRYQLPHYLNVIFPISAIIAAAWIIFHPSTGKWLQAVTVIQMIISFLILAAAAWLNAWAFPVNSGWVFVAVILLLALVFYFVKSRNYGLRQKAVCVSAGSMLFFFFLMNVNFYPQLLKYQGGKDLAESSSSAIAEDTVYVWDNTYSSSFHFHSGKFRVAFHDSIFLLREHQTAQQNPTAPGDSNRVTVWLLFDENEEKAIRERYLLLEPVFSAEDFEVTRLTLKFLDPATRKNETTRLVLARITPK